MVDVRSNARTPVREFLLNAPASRYNNKKLGYPSFRSDISLDLSHITDELHDTIVKYFPRYFQETDELSIDNFISNILHKESLFKGSELTVPHVDSVGSVFAGVVYLNSNDDKVSGTSFYRNRALNNISFMPVSDRSRSSLSEDEERQLDDISLEYGISCPIDFWNHSSCSANDEIYFSDENDNWTSCLSVESKFNRLIFYEAKQFHSVSGKIEDFSDNLLRINQALFWS
ncbi:MAG: DUF6445 family protein [Bacteriovoracaceae bacterium]